MVNGDEGSSQGEFDGSQLGSDGTRATLRSISNVPST